MMQQKLTGIAPLWIPSDIDVFVFGDVLDFQAICNEFERNTSKSIPGVDLEMVENAVTIDFYFTLENDVPLMKLSFVHTLCSTVIDTFDINVCKVIMMPKAGKWTCYMAPTTADDIMHGDMRCCICVPVAFKLYQKMKTGFRIEKYQKRGYKLCEFLIENRLGNMKFQISGTLRFSVTAGEDQISREAEMPALLFDDVEYRYKCRYPMVMLSRRAQFTDIVAKPFDAFNFESEHSDSPC